MDSAVAENLFTTSEAEWEDLDAKECAEIEAKQRRRTHVPNERFAGAKEHERKVLASGKTIDEHRKAVTRLSPHQELIMRMYACGQASRNEAQALMKVSQTRLSILINSKHGQEIIASVRGELEHRFQAQFEKVLNVLDEGLVHPEPSVALASAGMWFKYARAQKVEVKITAEDLIGKIMSGDA